MPLMVKGGPAEKLRMVREMIAMLQEALEEPIHRRLRSAIVSIHTTGRGPKSVPNVEDR